MKKALTFGFYILAYSLLTGCASEKLVILDGAPQATIELQAYGLGRLDETRISLAGPIECSAFLWQTQVNRKATPIVSVSINQPRKSAKIPAGKETLLVLGQNIDDRTASLFWSMLIKPNAIYQVSVKSEVKDKIVIGTYATAVSIVVLENGKPITVTNVDAPTEADCIKAK